MLKFLQLKALKRDKLLYIAIQTHIGYFSHFCDQVHKGGQLVLAHSLKGQAVLIKAHHTGESIRLFVSVSVNQKAKIQEGSQALKSKPCFQ